MGKTAIVAGHICLDITPVFPNDIGKQSDLRDLLSPGKLIRMDDVDVHTGGAVSNTGLGMKVLGTDVKLVAKIGSDEFGTIIRRYLEAYHVAQDLIEVSSENTSYSIVLAIPGIDRIFLHCPGANDTFVWEDIPRQIFDSASLFHFGYPPLMKKQYEDQGQELEKIFRNVRDMGIATSLDMAAIDPNSAVAKTPWPYILKRVLPLVDFFVPSYEELCFMLDKDHYTELQKISNGQDITEILEIERDIRPLAQKCIELGARAVLLKCGSKGMYLKTSDCMKNVGGKLELEAKQWNSFSKFQDSYPIEKVISGSGAGDTSIAAFLCSVLNGYGPFDSLKHAVVAGALCCMSYDAISGLKSLTEIHEMEANNWPVYKKEKINADKFK